MVPHECHRIGAKSGNASLFCNNFTTNQITTPPSGRFTLTGKFLFFKKLFKFCHTSYSKILRREAYMEGNKLKKRETRLDASNEKCNNLTYSINLHLKNGNPKEHQEFPTLERSRRAFSRCSGTMSSNTNCSALDIVLPPSPVSPKFLGFLDTFNQSTAQTPNP